MLKPGKDYVPWEELEAHMVVTGRGERELTAELQLGMYSLRDWKRKGLAPAWSVRYLEAIREIDRLRNIPQTTVDTMVLAQMTDPEIAEWEAATATAKRIYDNAAKKVK